MKVLYSLSLTDKEKKREFEKFYYEKTGKKINLRNYYIYKDIGLLILVIDTRDFSLFSIGITAVNFSGLKRVYSIEELNNFYK